MLSKILEEIVEVAGYAPALELCRAFGGRTVRVPQTMVETHPIALTMGYHPARALAERFGGEPVSVPAERSALLAQRDEQIAVRYREGATVSGLAADYGLSRKRVADVLDKMGVERRGLRWA